MPAGRPTPRDADLKRYLAARAEAAAQHVADDEMIERVAVGVGLVRPRRPRRTVLARLALVAAALTALVAIGYGAGVLNPRPTPTPATTESPTPDPSPSALVALPNVAYPGRAIAATDDAVWVADANGELAELDPETGAVLRRLDIPRAASALLITVDSVWVSSDAGDLVRVDRATLTVTPIPGAVGHALAASDVAIWLGATDEVVRVDPASNSVTLRVPVAGRSPDLGIVAIGTTLWVATRSEIVRIDATSGAASGRIPGDASRLAFGGGRLWAIRGSELLQIDPDAVVVVTFTPGLPGTSPIAVGLDRIWVGGPGGGVPSGSVVGVSIATAQIDRVGALPTSVRDLAAGPGAVWITQDRDEGPFELFRFSAP